MDKIKEIRVAVSRAINTLPYLHKSREMSLVHTSLQRTKGWLGQTLKELGSETPYVNSANPENAVIEKESDRDESYFQHVTTLGSHTARVKELRAMFDILIRDITEKRNGYPLAVRLPSNTKQVVADFAKSGIQVSESASSITIANDTWGAINEALISIKDAKMWLGWELGRIRDIKENEGKPQSGGVSQELPL